MKYNTALIFVLGAVHGQSADPFAEGTDLVKNLRQQVIGCNDKARTWIRAVFHDAATFVSGDKNLGGMDGSLQFELSRPESNGLGPTVNFLASTAKSFGVSVADTIAFGGKVAIEACLPQGSSLTVPFQSGRIDATEANFPNRIPSIHVTADQIITQFKNNMGFDETSIVALIGGAHSIAKVSTADIPDASFNGFLDSSPQSIDIDFLKELLSSTGNKLPSDSQMLQNSAMKSACEMFISKPDQFVPAFISAFVRLTNLGFTIKTVSDNNTPEPISPPSSKSQSSAKSTPCINSTTTSNYGHNSSNQITSIQNSATSIGVSFISFISILLSMTYQ